MTLRPSVGIASSTRGDRQSSARWSIKWAVLAWLALLVWPRRSRRASSTPQPEKFWTADGTDRHPSGPTGLAESCEMDPSRVPTCRWHTLEDVRPEFGVDRWLKH